MTRLWQALLEELDDQALDELARRLASRLPTADAAGQPEAGYLAPVAAAAYLGVSRQRIYALRSIGKLEPDHSDGRTPLYTRAQLDAYARSSEP